MKKYYIVVVADMNDADYVTSVTEIDQEYLDKIKPFIEKIKNFKPYTVNSEGMNFTHYNNFPCGEYCPREDLGEKSVQELYCETEEDQNALEYFLDCVPNGEYGIHTIKEVYAIPFAEKIELL